MDFFFVCRQEGRQRAGGLSGAQSHDLLHNTAPGIVPQVQARRYTPPWYHEAEDGHSAQEASSQDSDKDAKDEFKWKALVEATTTHHLQDSQQARQTEAQMAAMVL